jgi:hypothetical protein
MSFTRPALRHLLVFYLLLYLVGMAHEAGHLVTGWFACDAFVGVGFNVVQWPAGCPTDSTLAHWAAFAGPAVSYTLMLLGAWLATNGRQATLGAALVLANLPFARVFTAAYGGGDEVGLGRELIGAPAGRWVALAVVLVLSLLPVAIVASRVPALRRPGVLVAWLILPMLADFAIRHRALDGLLARVDAPLWLGVSTVVWLVSALALAGCVMMGGLRTLARPVGAAGA